MKFNKSTLTFAMIALVSAPLGANAAAPCLNVQKIFEDLKPADAVATSQLVTVDGNETTSGSYRDYTRRMYLVGSDGDKRSQAQSGVLPRAVIQEGCKTLTLQSSNIPDVAAEPTLEDISDNDDPISGVGEGFGFTSQSKLKIVKASSKRLELEVLDSDDGGMLMGRKDRAIIELIDKNHLRLTRKVADLSSGMNCPALGFVTETHSVTVVRDIYLREGAKASDALANLLEGRKPADRETASTETREQDKALYCAAIASRTPAPAVQRNEAPAAPAAPAPVQAQANAAE